MKYYYVVYWTLNDLVFDKVVICEDSFSYTDFLKKEPLADMVISVNEITAQDAEKSKAAKLRM